ncbi:cyclophilin-like fold protein [Collinsella tanakaei]|uniref:cyclophilin-like fold protein n=1 Tax=Collinsella tanakaei TaxID=626935 RepID=UPI0025A4092C|nr:cyclophilin-like fold protein [Collinsella tanakaei]MDM8302638.1 cyclophilin-like fold protein [Collinsella tanakaei]
MAQDIAMHFGDATVSAQLNDTATARAFAALLPVTVRMSASAVGVCGAASFELPVDSASIHRGWANGDINYNPGGGWLAVFFDDEENSLRYGDQLTIGCIAGPLTTLRALSGTYDVLIEACA